MNSYLQPDWKRYGCHQFLRDNLNRNWGNSHLPHWLSYSRLILFAWQFCPSRTYPFLRNNSNDWFFLPRRPSPLGKPSYPNWRQRSHLGVPNHRLCMRRGCALQWSELISQGLFLYRVVRRRGIVFGSTIPTKENEMLHKNLSEGLRLYQCDSVIRRKGMETVCALFWECVVGKIGIRWDCHHLYPAEH